MGVGAREMGYMFGQYRRLASHVQVNYLSLSLNFIFHLYYICTFVYFDDITSHDTMKLFVTIWIVHVKI